MGISTRLTKQFGIEHPIIQAPMAFAAGGKLAAAVTSAGGLGLIGGGYGDEDWLAAEFANAGNQRVGCGFITWSLAENPSLLTQALLAQADAIFLSFGDPLPFVSEIRSTDAKLICQVQTIEQACQAIDAGADTIVAQGAEAGGHGMARATMTLVPEVADWISKTGSEATLCAAGGIADGRGLAAALMLGADGVLVGSRFWASQEALVAPKMLATAMEASGDKTIRSSVMDIARSRNWPKGFTARVLENDFTKQWHGNEQALQGDRAAHEAWAQAWVEGNPIIANTFVGEGVGLIHNVLRADEIINDMVSEAETCIRRAQSNLT